LKNKFKYSVGVGPKTDKIQLREKIKVEKLSEIDFFKECVETISKKSALMKPKTIQIIVIFSIQSRT